VDTANITPEDARALLHRDQVNRLRRVAEKGGLLTEPDRRRLRAVVRRAQTRPKAEQREKQTTLPTEREFLQRQRRRKVYVMRLRNHTIRDMADELKVDKNTILRDLKAIDAALQTQIDPAHATMITNERLADLEAVRLIALEALPETEGNERAALLNTITKASEVMIGLLQDSGTLPKAGRRLELTGPDGKPFTMPTETKPTVVVVNVQRDADSDRAAKLFGERPANQERT
jgi:hypothetical protein